MKKNEFDILTYILQNGKKSYREMKEQLDLSIGSISSIMKNLAEQDYLKDDQVSEKGLKALEPYKVKNAIILAAGPSSRFVPLSLEQPKGLFKVKNEILIERQIEQLLQSGIKNIYVVLGYKKESFFYLKEKYGINIIINPSFNKKNNIESLFLARKHIDSSYICSCDDYFIDNPFNLYEYKSFYASIETSKKTDEMYVEVNSKDEIIKMKKGLSKGLILLGHSYWDKEFSYMMVSLIEQAHDNGEYDNAFWEKLVKDNLKKLPPFSIKRYPSDKIFEFDFVEELRAFDEKYINNTESKIMSNICKVFLCDEKDIINFKPIHEGLTNTSFIFEVNHKKYVYRQPGEGTKSIINREHEKKVLEFAKKNDFDSTFLYMDELEGYKISYYVEEFYEPDYLSFDDSKKVIEVLRKLHSVQDDSINWEFRPWEEALEIEKIIKEKSSIQMSDFEDLKSKVGILYERIRNDGVKKCICHCDTYKYNWMMQKDKVILIDWEYSGISDPGVDVGYYIVDAMYDFDEAERFIKEYCEDEYNETLRNHYLSYVAIIAYYWFVWALYRELMDADMGSSLYNWYSIAKKYSDMLVKTNIKLTRSQFELMKYLVEKKSVNTSIRFLANELGFSWNTLTEDINKCLTNGYIYLNENNYYISDKGLKILDEYKVSRAIILAAGFGSRMAPVTLYRPKPLVKINGVRIIDTLLDALIKQDIKDIYIVRGYKKEMFDELLEKYPFIHFIDNDDYAKTNNISSIMKVLPLVDNTYICEADFMISSPHIISKYHYSSNYLGAKVFETDDWSFRSKDGLAYDYKKGNVNCYNAYGISYWNKNDCKKIREYVPQVFASTSGKQEFWETIVFYYYQNDFAIEINECKKEDIIEIDNFSELVELDPSYKNYR